MDPVGKQEIFRISDQKTFRETALKVFFDQANHTSVYRDYLATLGIDPARISQVEAIPFLPVEFFRSHTVLREGQEAAVVFESSGTTTASPSRHHVADLKLYQESLVRGFTHFYGDPTGYCVLALVPSPAKDNRSSLVHMMNHLVALSGHSDSGFYLERTDRLYGILQQRNRDKHPTLLLGVSYALMDLADRYPLTLGPHITLMETGGMKGRRKELVRNELHEILGSAFGTGAVHSEYGMTELLSQAYSLEKGIFQSPPWMQVLLRDPDDPLTPQKEGRIGGINIIDLANLHSCSFIATGDLGKLLPDGRFEILGRFDHSDIRGCNLLV